MKIFLFSIIICVIKEILQSLISFIKYKRDEKLWKEIGSSSTHKYGDFNTGYELYFKELEEGGDDCSNINIHIEESLSSDAPFYLLTIKTYIQR